MRVRNIFVCLFVLATSAIAQADSLRLAYTPGAGGFSYGDGGEFGAYNLSANFPYAAPMPAVSKVAGYDFQTFCVQSTVTFSPGTLYLTNQGLTDSQGTSLTNGAAFLFDKFWNGTLTSTGVSGFGNAGSYNYTLGSGRQASAGVLQYALWLFQGKPIPTGYGFEAVATLANALVAYVNTTLGTVFAHSAYNGSALASGNSVRILQLTDAGGTFHQAQLIEIHEPGLNLTAAPLPSAAIGGLGLFGILGLLTVIRRPAIRSN